MNKKTVYTRKRNIGIKKALIAYKGGKCQRCGYCKDIPRVYDFHHSNPDEKDFTIGNCKCGLEILKKEADKCILVCKNCHAEIHHELDIDKYNEATSYKVRESMVLYEKKCKTCGNSFITRFENQQTCKFGCNKAKMPNREELENKFKELNSKRAVKYFKCSHATLIEWLDFYKIPHNLTCEKFKKECLRCGNVFETTQKKKKYCNFNCYTGATPYPTDNKKFVEDILTYGKKEYVKMMKSTWHSLNDQLLRRNMPTKIEKLKKYYEDLCNKNIV